MRCKPKINSKKEPLVSVLIFNYNYGKYLRECFDSVLNQTYGNVEICFSDNASDDNSLDIAIEYSRKYPGIINLACNRQNFGVGANFANCMFNARGKYYIQLGSDDMLMPEFVAKCVKELEEQRSAGFAIVHKKIMDEYGKIKEEPPFYNHSCLIFGDDQAAVYMMAAVNPSISQVMYNKIFVQSVNSEAGLSARWYASRLLDFTLSCNYDVIYLDEPLLIHRLHSQNDSFSSANSLMEIIGPYVLQHQYAEMAAGYNNYKVIERLPQSIEKISGLSLRYCTRALINNNRDNAFRYYHLAAALDPKIIKDRIYVLISKFWESNEEEKMEIIESLETEANLVTRNVSYDPPVGSIPLITEKTIFQNTQEYYR